MRLVADQLDPAVDVPADNQDLPLGGLETFSQRSKIVLAIDEPAEAAGATDEPAVVVVEN
jgi:hypothetical protein